VRAFRIRSRLAAPTGVVLVVLACGTPIIGPPTGPHRSGAGNDALIVNNAPPPVQAECVPPQPRPECVWVDGSWSWAGRRWEWVMGAWVVPPRDCYHADAYSQWIDSGAAKEGEAGSRLFYFSAAWYPNRTDGKCSTPKVCLRATPIEDC
jgi:hypothetical protein